MRITPTFNHGKPRWRLNVQRQSYRKRLFFGTEQEALAFAYATGGPVRFGLSRRQSPLSRRQLTRPARGDNALLD